MAPQPARFSGWRMALLCSLAQNCAFGLTLGSYGSALVALQHEIGVGRAAVSYGLGVMLLALGLVSPFVGILLERQRVVTVMTVGAVMNACGYLLLSRAGALWEVLTIFGLLIGPGAGLLGMIPASTLVSRWFERDRGKALAITNVPAFIFLVPPMAGLLVEYGGPRLLFLVLAAVFVALIPLLFLLIERPEDVGQTALHYPDRPLATASPATPFSTTAILRDARFWTLSFGVGILTGAGTFYTTHIVPLASQSGVGLAAASLPLSCYGGGALLGAALFGWLIDRFGPLPVLIANAATAALLWFALIVVSSLSGLAALGVLMGCCAGGIVALHGAAMGDILGPAGFSRGMGLSYFAKTPFLFGMAPLGGYLYDLAGTYDLALIVIGMFATASALLFVGLRLLSRVPRPV